MKTTPIYGWPYPESGDHTRTWEYWQNQATAIENSMYNASGVVGGFIQFLAFADQNNLPNNTATNIKWAKYNSSGTEPVVPNADGINMGIAGPGTFEYRFRVRTSVTSPQTAGYWVVTMNSSISGVGAFDFSWGQTVTPNMDLQGGWTIVVPSGISGSVWVAITPQSVGTAPKLWQYATNLSFRKISNRGPNP